MCWFDCLECLFSRGLNKTNETYPTFTISGVYTAKVVNVYDGDTVHAVMRFNGKFQKFSVRIYGIDTPERKVKMGTPDRDSLKAAAELARMEVVRLVLNKIVVLKCRGFDKYGRLLANIVTREGVDVSQHLLSRGMAVPYFGGKK